MAKKDDGTITIANFQKDTAVSSYFGFEEIRGLDTKSKPGAVFPGLAPQKESGSTVDDLIEGTVLDADGTMYGYTQIEGNSIFKRTTGGVWTAVTGFASGGISGLAFWKGFLIVIHLDGGVDASDDGGTSWTNDFTTISNKSNTKSPSIVAQDDKLYIGSGNVVDRILQVIGKVFDPTDNTTWTTTLSALPLKSTYDIRSIVELGASIVLGIVDNASTTEAIIIPWNKTDEGSGQPVRIKENGISYMIEVENLLYIMAGKRGRWYVSNGTAVSFLAEIPKTLLDITTYELETSYNDAVAYLDGMIYFGVSQGSDKKKLGVYSLNLQSKRINFAHIISTGETGENDGIFIGSITTVQNNVSGVLRDALCITWLDQKDTDTYGADAQDDTRYTGDQAFLISQFIRTGTSLAPKTQQKIQVYLTRPMIDGDSVKIYKRTAQGADWGTVIKTWSAVGDQELYTPFSPTTKNEQFKIVLNNTAELLEASIA